MTKILAVSDLHWEGRAIMPDQADKLLGEADILFLAGDIINARYLDQNPRCHFGTFLKLAKERCTHVVAIAGNHEPYHRNMRKTHDFLREYYEDHGTVYLNNEFVELNKVRIFGGTMWTNHNNSDAARATASMYMNDYRFIKVDREDNKFGIEERLITPYDTEQEHDIFIREYKRAFSEHGPIDIVVSHHAPHANSVPAKFKNEYPLNYAYYTDLTALIEIAGPRLWIHGHMHSPSNYMVGNTRVYCNPWGYRHENNQLNLKELVEP